MTMANGSTAPMMAALVAVVIALTMWAQSNRRIEVHCEPRSACDVEHVGNEWRVTFKTEVPR